MDKFHKPRTHKDRTKYDRKNVDFPELTWSRSMLELDSREFLKKADPDWAAICETIDDMTQIEKMDFLRARIGSPRLDKMDRDEYDGVIGDWLLNEWPELPLTENVGT